MDRFDAMRAFIRIVERRSFTLAAQDIAVPRSTITQTIKQLEARLGVRLLQRTTRTVNPTLGGEAYYRRCIAIIDDVEDAEGAFGSSKPKGMLRIEVQGTLARHFLMPGLLAFFAQYPGIEITMTERDRYVDIVREGVDCVLRFGALPDRGAFPLIGLTILFCPDGFYSRSHAANRDWQLSGTPLGKTILQPVRLETARAQRHNCFVGEDAERAAAVGDDLLRGIKFREPRFERMKRNIQRARHMP
jgi:DNA-binding transcriptional LysR family regulator